MLDCFGFLWGRGGAEGRGIIMNWVHMIIFKSTW
jgi:hypothetical protein